jgi:quinohemoprotein ethanol dehydrogenase
MTVGPSQWRPTTVSVSIVVTIFVLSSLSGLTQIKDGRTHGDANWTFIGGDWANSRYSTLKTINTKNVSKLGAAWSFQFDGGASTRATPVVKDGVMFIGAGTRLYAIDAVTGEPIWVVSPDENAPANLDTAGIGDILNSGRAIPSPPGVALGDGKVFVGLMDGHVAAVTQETGEFIWSTQIGYNPPKKGQAVSGAPIYVDNVVYVGLANGDWAFRGKIVALDANKGELLWEFYTIPDPGEPGHNTWPQDSEWGHVWEQGGAGVWHVGNADPNLGLVYFVTGNAVPMFGGEARKGNNLFTASVLALDMKSGELRWHYQVVHHDLWDADIAVAPLLYNSTVDGQTRPAIAALRADGFFFLLDRETGKPLHPVEEREVPQDPYNFTAPTQPFPVGAESIVGDCSQWQDKVAPPFVLNCSGFTPPYLNTDNVVAPGAPIPRVRVTPISYSPDTGYLYAQGTASIGRARRISADPWFRGSARSYTNLPNAVGVFAAIDAQTNRVVWKHEVDPGILGTSGPLTTAGGLMFRAAADGTVQAYDARTGEHLWQFQTGVRGARGPSMTYQANGSQYVAVAMGPELWTFRLGGTLSENDPPPTIRQRSAGQETNEIMTSTLVQSADRGVGLRYAVDEHAFSPPRVRVGVGTIVSFINSGNIRHTVSAQDASWTTGQLLRGQSSHIRMDQVGTFTYSCEDHPWAMGRITVEP